MIRAARLRPSRALALAGLALGGAIVYFLAVVGAVALLHARDGVTAALLLFALPLVCAILAGALIPAPRTRAWAKVMLAKHLFAHRYDYRHEWLRFTETLGRPGEAPAPLDLRVVKALADITDSPGGLLLLPREGALIPEAAWNRPLEPQRPSRGLTGLLTTGRIVEVDPLRATESDEAAAIPEWILADEAAWALVPLIHAGRLTGAVLLDRPVVGRTLDWEDFDLLRVAGVQVASYLAEAQGQEALSEVQRFDEFNRRFAFIMHDIKNLASQLTLVTRNAERHAENPAFRADMIATLKSSTARMNDLLARLSQHNKARPETPRAAPVGPTAHAAAAAARARHPVVVQGTELFAVHDPGRLETALRHLIDNAIDASPPTEPVTLLLDGDAAETRIAVIDQGHGMTDEFIRGELFRAFASTKADGFGVGAHEARTLVTAMGGRLHVESAPGKGSRFTIYLPAAIGRPEADAA